MMKRDFKKALGQFDHEAQNVPVGPSSARVWARLSRDEQAPSRWRIALGAAAAVMLLVIGVAWWRSHESKMSSVSGFTVQLSEGTVVVERDGTVMVSHGDCVLNDQDMEVDASADTQLRRSKGAIQLVKGKVTVKARHRRKDERPLRFLVSGGTVEVVGTRFTIIDDGAAGKLTLHEGVVRFSPHSGATTELRAGETIDWPQIHQAEAPPEPTPNPVVEKPDSQRETKKKTKRVVKTAPVHDVDELDEVLERVAELRDRGEYESAVAELRRALGTVHETTTRERLSFEIGSLLTHQLKDRARACEHWQKHMKRFGAARYGQEIRLLSQQLRCEVD